MFFRLLFEKFLILIPVVQKHICVSVFAKQSEKVIVHRHAKKKSETVGFLTPGAYEFSDICKKYAKLAKSDCFKVRNTFPFDPDSEGWISIDNMIGTNVPLSVDETVLTSLSSCQVVETDILACAESLETPKLYLLPSLLVVAEIEVPKNLYTSGYIKLERQFRLDIFMPPGIIQRILAKSSSYDSDSFLNIDNSTYWAKSFKRTFFSPSYGAIDIYLNLVEDNGCLGVITVIGIGHFTSTQTINILMDRMCKIVSDELNKYPGLCKVELSVVCPICTMKQQGKHSGSFSSDEIKSLGRKLLSETEPKFSREDNFLSSCRLYCSRRNCCVTPDLLMTIPDSRFKDLDKKSNADDQFTSLKDNLIQLSLPPIDGVKNAVCKVMFGFVDDNVLWGSGKNNFDVASGNSFCSGCFVNVDGCGIFVYTCEHFLGKVPVALGNKALIFLIGGPHKHTHYLS